MGLTTKLGGPISIRIWIIGVISGAVLTVVSTSPLDPNSYELLFGTISIFTVGRLLNTFGFFNQRVITSLFHRPTG